jgi:PEP-CTERM motif
MLSQIGLCHLGTVRKSRARSIDQKSAIWLFQRLKMVATSRNVGLTLCFENRRLIMRTTLWVLAGTALAALSVPAHATTVFSDNFNTEDDGPLNGGSALNYTGFANFNSTGAGFVDVVNSGDFGIICAGKCVDLDGSPGPGSLESISSFAFNAGDKIRLSFDIGGSQRSGASDSYLAGFTFLSAINMVDYGFNFFGSDTIVFPGSTFTTGVSTSTGINGGDPFATRSIFFTAGNAGSLRFNFSSSSADNIGPLLDNVSLDISAVPEPASWAMMIAGFSLVGAGMRRRATKVRFVTA